MKKQTIPRILSCVLALLMSMVFAVEISAASTQSDEVTTDIEMNEISGTYDGIRYLISGGKVTISEYIGSESVLIIPSQIEGYPVTSIGSNAFSDCESLTSITIPEGVKSVGPFAFNGTAYYDDTTNWEDDVLYIDSVLIDAKETISGDYSIKEGTTVIADYAFAWCESLTSITIPKSVTSIGDEVLLKCKNLTSVSVDKDNKEYDSRENCNAIIETPTNTLIYGLKNTIIPESVESIGNSAFSHCENIMSITIPESVENIGDSAFSFCESLKSITIPKGVKSIDQGAFRGCESLTSITIPESVENIGDGAFSGCRSLKSLIISDGVISIGFQAFCGCESLTSVTFPESVENIGDEAFDSCKKLTSITIPEGVKIIGDGAFLGCWSLTSITIPESVTIIGVNAFLVGDKVESINVDEDNKVYDSRGNCNAIIETSTNTLIRGCSNTVIPESVTIIGDHALSYCESLTNIAIPEGVKSIGDYAFSECESFTGITLPEGLESIGEHAFYGTGDYNDTTNWEDGVLYIGSALVEAEDTISGDYSIKEGTTVIADYAFSWCENLTGITIPKGVTSIGKLAFSSCEGLTSINVDKDNKVYDSRNKCNAIIETATNKLIVGCNNTTIPDGVDSIGDGAFCGCESLTSITIPQGVKRIGDSAFERCRSLASITIPEGITSIGNSMFKNCWGLTSITIPKEVKSIGQYAFYECYYLTDVYYIGTQEDWETIKIDVYNDDLLDASIHFENIVTEPSKKDYITDEKTNISVAGNTAGELVISEITSNEDIAAIDSILFDEKVNRVFDITLQRDGEEIQPDERVWVRIPVDNPKAKVYRMEENGTLTDMEAVFNDGYLVFTTEHFSLYVVVEPKEDTGVIFVVGDTNNDSKVNIKDATKIQKVIANLLVFGEIESIAADVDSNGDVNVKDATAIQKWVAGIDTGFLIGGEKTKDNL